MVLFQSLLKTPPLVFCRTMSRLAAVVQLTCTADKAANLARSKALVTKAKRDLNASVVFLPEAFDYIGESVSQTKQLAESLDGELMSHYKSLARDLGVELSLGGFHENCGDKVKNTHVFIDASGSIRATYSKNHLFDVDIPEKSVRLKESDYVQAGDKIVEPVDSQVGNIGLGICYDLRFPEMSLSLVKRGAQVLTYPSAFTVPTGMAHWEALLRARAIESQCYVVAAAQTGKHNAKRASYGHSMIVDPWGRVIAQCSEEEGVAAAEINLDYVAQVRQNMPVMRQRRGDLYGLIDGDDFQVADDDDAVYAFSQIKISGAHVVLTSRHAYVAVNRKPVLPYHLLVIPRRPSAVRLGDLTPEENADFFNLLAKAQKLAEHVTGATSSTVTVQDGPEAGQSVRHLHAHILARKNGDFEKNDEIYDRLASHDHGEEGERGWRTPEEMAKEASFLREIAAQILFL